MTSALNFSRQRYSRKEGLIRQRKNLSKGKTGRDLVVSGSGEKVQVAC